jgi:hypothetical protein
MTMLLRFVKLYLIMSVGLICSAAVMGLIICISGYGNLFEIAKRQGDSRYLLLFPFFALVMTVAQLIGGRRKNGAPIQTIRGQH